MISLCIQVGSLATMVDLKCVAHVAGLYLNAGCCCSCAFLVQVVAQVNSNPNTTMFAGELGMQQVVSLHFTCIPAAWSMLVGFQCCRQVSTFTRA
jgi:hypothetical protein